jgi:hypothetical protein
MSVNKFPAFAKLVAMSFQDRVRNANVFVADLEGDDVYAKYLAAFPEGTNPVFKKNTEHDCSCCKQFIRRAGSVITIDGAVHTVWDRAAESAPSPYREVAVVLRDTVRAVGVRDVKLIAVRPTFSRSTLAPVAGQSITTSTEANEYAIPLMSIARMGLVAMSQISFTPPARGRG